MSQSRSWSLSQVGLIGGFVAFAIAVLVAYRAPATGYELSIYGATPTLYWVLVAVAVLCSLVIAVMGGARFRNLALFLGGVSVFSVVALPVIRGYFFLGAGDSLTHLGWARDIVSGQTPVTEILYPGIHTFAILLSMVTGYSLEHSFLFVVLAFIALTFLLVPRIAALVFPQDDAVVVIATFSTFLLLPINTISTHLAPHSFSQAVFFGSLTVFLFFRYVSSNRPESSTFRPTAIGALLGITGIATVLYHPMQALNILVLLGLAAAVQYVARRTDRWEQFHSNRPVYAQTAILAVALFLWIIQRAAFLNTVGAVERTVEGYLSGTPPTAAGAAASQGASLAAIGVSIEEIFLKLFLVSVIFIGLTGVLAVATLSSRFDDMPETTAKIQYLTLGALGTLPFALVYIFGNIGELHFRLLGYLMVIATVLGAVMITLSAIGISPRMGARTAHVGIVLAFVILLPLALLAAFPSPYIYQPNQQVTEAQLDGYHQAFTLQNETLTVQSVRQGPWRYNDAVLGVEASEETEYDNYVPDNGLTDLNSSFEGQGYLAITDYDRERELVAYKELRYSQEGFDALDATPGVNRVISNGDFTLFFVEDFEERAESTETQQTFGSDEQSAVSELDLAGGGAAADATRPGGGDGSSVTNAEVPDRETDPPDDTQRTSDEPANDDSFSGSDSTQSDDSAVTPDTAAPTPTTDEPVGTPNAEETTTDEPTSLDTGEAVAAVNDTRVARVEQRDERQTSTTTQRERDDDDASNDGKAKGHDKDEKENRGNGDGKAKGRDADRSEERRGERTGEEDEREGRDDRDDETERERDEGRDEDDDEREDDEREDRDERDDEDEEDDDDRRDDDRERDDDDRDDADERDDDDDEEESEGDDDEDEGDRDDEDEDGGDHRDDD
ncbi:hypothetical protein ACFQJC_17780 [Haloferax namakaokahaiae]|uniref:Uncharacterized protein n=1 Tax=Haloferax namakaokahaiae TaxID=1748331 RepID=A0ABD5ZJJ0_9EURY